MTKTNWTIEFDKQFTSRTPQFLGYPKFNHIPKPDDLKTFISKTRLEAVEEEREKREQEDWRGGMTKKTEADNFLFSLENDPKAVIEWCEEEIEAYQRLIKLIKEKTSK